MTVPLADNIKAILQPFVGLVEIQPNQRFRGPTAFEFVELLQRAGWETGLPYCAFTVSEAVKEAYAQAGVKRPPALWTCPDGSTSALARYARSQSALHDIPATGAIAVMKGGETGWHHTEFVWEVLDGGRMLTFGANTINPADADQQGVFFHNRAVSDFQFIY